MMLIQRLFILIILYVLSSVSTVYADTDLENTNLARIKQVLASLTPLIDEAEQQQDTQARIIFHYDGLRNDIAKIQQGIDEKLKQAPIEPRTVVPIKGDYLTYHSKHA